MTEQQTPTRASARQRLAEARSVIESTLAGSSDEELFQLKVTPEWNAAQVLSHTLAWGELAMRCLDDWHGDHASFKLKNSDHYDENKTLMERTGVSAPSEAQQRLNLVYERMEALLDSMSDQELAEEGEAPWSEPISRIALMISTFEHDIEHAEQIIAARKTA